LQDLILRHRVKGYQAGDLEQRYSSLGIEEDILYAYGFLPRRVWNLLHPRSTTSLSELWVRAGGPHPLTGDSAMIRSRPK
jgi:uncharacterized protein YcaQ